MPEAAELLGQVAVFESDGTTEPGNPPFRRSRRAAFRQATSNERRRQEIRHHESFAVSFHLLSRRSDMPVGKPDAAPAIVNRAGVASSAGMPVHRTARCNRRSERNVDPSDIDNILPGRFDEPMGSQIKRIGLLTAGGDCPGLNAVIRAVTKSAIFRLRERRSDEATQGKKGFVPPIPFVAPSLRRFVAQPPGWLALHPAGTSCDTIVGAVYS